MTEKKPVNPVERSTHSYMGEDEEPDLNIAQLALAWIAFIVIGGVLGFLLKVGINYLANPLAPLHF